MEYVIYIMIWLGYAVKAKYNDECGWFSALFWSMFFPAAFGGVLYRWAKA